MSNNTISGLNELAAEIHENAKAHGWYDNAPTFPEVIATMHSELSEALEEYRAGKPPLYYVINTEQGGETIPAIRADVYNPSADEEFAGEKPQGLAVELADAVMRILDTCAFMEIDIERVIRLKHEYNKSRPYRHGGKKI
jgi:NTP pyrophosphatase (non-canonical NTP hydrolase)